jgi:hypothetical protein
MSSKNCSVWDGNHQNISLQHALIGELRGGVLSLKAMSFFDALWNQSGDASKSEFQLLGCGGF